MKKKINGFELLQKMKDKEILEGTKIYSNRFTDTSIYIVYEHGRLNLYNENGERYDKDRWTSVITAEDLLEYTFEIIEEDKKIEKLNIEKDDNSQNYFIRNEFGTKCYLTKHSKIIADKVNEVLDIVFELKKGE